MDPKRLEELMAKRVEELGKCRLAVDKASSEKAKGQSIYNIRTVSSKLLLLSGISVSFLAGLGQKSSVLCVLLCPNGP